MANSKQRKEQNVILDSISEGVFTVDLDWRITSFNRAAEEITSIKRQKVVGKRRKDVLRAYVCETDCTLAETMETGKPIMNKAVHIIDANGKRRAIAISTALLKDSKGKVIGGVETFRDMSMVEQLRKESEGVNLALYLINECKNKTFTFKGLKKKYFELSRENLLNKFRRN